MQATLKGFTCLLLSCPSWVDGLILHLLSLNRSFENRSLAALFLFPRLLLGTSPFNTALCNIQYCIDLLILNWFIDYFNSALLLEDQRGYWLFRFLFHPLTFASLISSLRFSGDLFWFLNRWECIFLISSVSWSQVFTEVLNRWTRIASCLFLALTFNGKPVVAWH